MDYKQIFDALVEAGAEVYYVGGFVRDKLLNKENKDIDVEIFNITPQKLKEVLSEFGQVDEVGASFGVLKIHNLDIDFTMPRRENSTGVGHTSFEVTVDPFMSTKEAAQRRDFTMNALMQNYATGEITDHFGGIKDLQDKTIRHINDTHFVEDELRVLRACQFSSRLGFNIAEDTVKLCKTLDISNLPKERIMEEISKGLLKSEKPSIFFEEASRVDALKQIAPELEELRNVPQSEIHHPEGSVWNHTMMVVDELAKIKDKSQFPLALMMSGVCHDVGKAITTKEVDGKIISHGHERETEYLNTVLDRLTENKNLKESIQILSENHMRPNQESIAFNGSDTAIKKLIVAAQGKSVNINDLLLLAEADYLGRGIPDLNYDKHKEWFTEKIAQNTLDNCSIKPIITGKDLIQCGVKPGKQMGNLSKVAFELQLQGLTKEVILDELRGKQAIVENFAELNEKSIIWNRENAPKTKCKETLNNQMKDIVFSRLALFDNSIDLKNDTLVGGVNCKYFNMEGFKLDSIPLSIEEVQNKYIEEDGKIKEGLNLENYLGELENSSHFYENHSLSVDYSDFIHECKTTFKGKLIGKELKSIMLSQLQSASKESLCSFVEYSTGVKTLEEDLTSENVLCPEKNNKDLEI